MHFLFLQFIFSHKSKSVYNSLVTTGTMSTKPDTKDPNPQPPPNPMVTIQYKTLSIQVPESVLSYHCNLMETAQNNVCVIKDGPEDAQCLTILLRMFQLIGESKRGYKDAPLVSNKLEDHYTFNGKVDIEYCLWMRSTFPFPGVDVKTGAGEYSREKFEEMKTKTLCTHMLNFLSRIGCKQLMRSIALYFTILNKLTGCLKRAPGPQSIPSAVAPTTNQSVSVPSQSVPMELST
jgi:hypothetical protein